MRTTVRSIILILIASHFRAFADDGASTAVFVEHVVVVPAKAIHEEGVALARGETVRFYFKASSSLNFNVHYHEGERVTFERSDKPLERLDGSLTADARRDYWLMWTNDSAEPVALYVTIRRQAKKF